MAMTKSSQGLCSVSGCRHAIDSARKMCNSHYCAWWRAVRLNDSERLPRCDICAGPHHARGWCRKHYLNWQARGLPTAVPPAMPEHCFVADCQGKPRRNGFCEKHWQRVQKHGDPAIRGLVGRPATRLDIAARLRKRNSRLKYLTYTKGYLPSRSERDEMNAYSRAVKSVQVAA